MDTQTLYASATKALNSEVERNQKLTKENVLLDTENRELKAEIERGCIMNNPKELAMSTCSVMRGRDAYRKRAKDAEAESKDLYDNYQDVSAKMHEALTRAETAEAKLVGLDAEQHRLYIAIVATVSNLVNKKYDMALQSARIGMYGESVNDPLAVEKMEAGLSKIKSSMSTTSPHASSNSQTQD